MMAVILHMNKNIFQLHIMSTVHHLYVRQIEGVTCKGNPTAPSCFHPPPHTQFVYIKHYCTNINANCILVNIALKIISIEYYSLKKIFLGTSILKIGLKSLLSCRMNTFNLCLIIFPHGLDLQCIYYFRG